MQSASPDPAITFIHEQQLCSGQLVAFQKLYRHFYAEFFKEVTKALKNPSEAPFIINHGFILCWLRSSALSSVNHTIAFLKNTITRTCIEFNQCNSHRSVHFGEIQRIILSDSIRGGATRKELFASIHYMPTELMIGTREAFSLFYGRRMPVSEVASQLGQPIAYIQEKLDLAYQTLHLILSTEPL